MFIFVALDKTDSKHCTEIPNFLSHEKCKAEQTWDSVFTGVWYLPTMKHYDEKLQSGAPFPSRRVAHASWAAGYTATNSHQPLSTS